MLQVVRQFNRVQAGFDPMLEFITYCIQSFIYKLSHWNCKLYESVRLKRFKRIFNHNNDDYYLLKDIKIPKLSEEYEKTLPGILNDVLTSYLYFDDKYDEETFEKCENLLVEGLYGLVNDKVNVTVEPGDNVIDVGSWVGDFAAYASLKVGKEGKIFAFEPVDLTYKYLEQTARLNGQNIIPVKKGLSDKNTNSLIYLDDLSSIGGNTLISKETEKKESENSNTVETIRLDDFVRENNLTHVDFIKADIEGFERYMLEGAQETLRKFAPKLALCTYHLPDDPEVMAALIKKANPAYNIVQKRKKLFASVPK